MSSYRPSYGSSTYSYAPPLPPPPGAMPPLPPGPPPPYNPHRGGDSWRPVPPQSDFSFHNSNIAPQYPRELDYQRSMRPRDQPTRDSRRPQQSDNSNLNQARRGQNYKGRQNYRAAPADRPLLRHQDEGQALEQMLGMVNGQKFMAAEDVSDSDDEEMDVSDSDLGENGASKEDPVSMPVDNDTGQNGGDQPERPSKRRVLSTKAQDGSSEPKWSNPDPYTVLPPVDEASRKRKDVVKLIRKARKEAEDIAAEHNQVADNDDFISFGIEDDEIANPASPDDHGQNRTDVTRQAADGRGVPGAPLGPRHFSHLNNLHGQEDSPISAQAPPTTIQLPVDDRTQDVRNVPEEIVLDLGRSAIQRSGNDAYIKDGDESLGNRKRTYDDSVTGAKRRPAYMNGSILPEWRPPQGEDATPWLRRSELITANTGFRLHKEICDFYDFVKPQHFEQTVRQELLSRLEETINVHIPNSRVHCFGSFAAGLYLPNADMDVVVISDSYSSSGRKVTCQTGNQMHKFARYLESSGLAMKKCEVISQAKVPIIKFVDQLTGIRVDVSFENDTGIVANATFAGWKTQFPAMPVLVTVIKQFLMMRGLNEVQHGGLGGFSVTCLVTSLLQNMPRVQAGELLPEQHLGEMLLEFFDFYGNQLDTRRTGIMMHPHGYFQKDIYTQNGANKRNATYQANKADRLAIIDPNKPDNDISGGSRAVILIFDRFALAHKELLRAMKSPGRISLLDWSLGGNYESFASQRDHLLNLYQQRRGSPADIILLDQPPDKGSTGHEQSFGAIRGGEGKPCNGATNAITSAAAQTTAKKPRTKAAVIVGPGSKKSKQAVMKGKKAKRAADLRIQFPDLQGIPDSINHKDKLKLVAEHTGQAIKPAKPAKVAKQAKQAKAPSKGQLRARRLKREYPDMINIPKQVGSKRRRALVDEYRRAKAADVNVRPQSENLGSAPQQRSVLNQALNERPLLSNPPKVRSAPQDPPVSKKMAPLSDARRAEVARNLGGTSTDNPITLD